MKKLTIIIIVFSVITAVAIAVMGVVWGTSAATIDGYKQQLNYTYQNNFYSLTDAVNNMETDLSKLSVSTDTSMQEKYLTEIVSLCETAQNCLASLPLEHNAITETSKFVHQLGGYCFTLHQKIVDGEDITLDEYAQIDDLYESCSDVKYELNRLANLINGGYSIVDNIQDSNVNINNFSGELSTIYDDTTEYPTLIYDGPFSDSVENKTIKGLSSTELNQTEAELKVKEWFSDWTVTASGETAGGDIDTWNFDLTKEGVSAYAQVTKLGGFLLQMGSDIEAGANNKTLDECGLLAEEFGKSLGIEDAEVVWSTDCSGFVYCNLVYIQDDVIVYPDMIKVKVSRDDGQVVGWEARSWAYNHTTRTDTTPTLTEADATEKLDAYLDLLTTKLTIIPADYVGENLAWEFKCLKSGTVYYVYIDAHTGADLNVMKVILTDDGELLM